ncbi:hypothetical protein ALI22I_05745 [Saccharothrix sp. ALI-22-I]|nr:hypothetical protein ALI22I_05745 [Saccharothrix sp. ALI-22-I]
MAGVIALITTAAAASASDTRSSAQAACRFEYTVTNFAGGFGALLTVTNIGPDPANGWWVEFDLAPGAVIQSTYGGKFLSYSGHIQVNAPDWLPNLAPGRYANIGFNGRNANITGVAVSNVTLNDVPCTT